ncbi:MAG: methyltransferase domain-containing protein [Lewinellaceae bacterium]|nr:methyltransferase domain-containing protein [Lewinellaceae bacterium]
MDKQYEKQYHELEKVHWWFVSRRRKVLSLLKATPDKTYLDIGCSSGYLLQELIEKGADPANVYGVDISPEGIQECLNKGLKNTFVMDATHIDLRQNHFDYIIASDCLEHIEEDRTALQNWYSLLKPGGAIIVFVPAFLFLWSPHDVVNHHFRRYTNAELREKLRAAGFDVQRTGYWNFVLFFPIALFRFLRNGLRKLGFGEKEATADLKPTPAPVNGLLKTLLGIENGLMEVVRFPFGVSTFCIARKQV